jgi:hypothetical protein
MSRAPADGADLTARYTLWRRDTLRNLDLNRIHSNGYSFQVETNYRAHAHPATPSQGAPDRHTDGSTSGPVLPKTSL